MIKIEHLTKIYKSSSKQFCKALDDLSFVLPNKGMVFVVGKSGSGKSTLLNLLGGLDNATSGDIYFDNVKFSEESGKENFDKFRNSYMGFVFQDYYLIESLTIFENVKFALDLQHTSNDEAVYNTLKLVDLEGFENRYPKELSGGQQQRVAIARAIIKNPNLILADEPTGNLDESTSIQILKILKELSKNSLVVIVSHNIEHAKQFGDRIIRLSEGKIISDKKRTAASEDLVINQTEIKLPSSRPLTEDEINCVNEKIKHKKYKFSKQEDIFSDTKEVREKAQTFKPMQASKLSTKKILNLSAKFTKSNIFTFIATTFIVAFLVTLFGLCQILMAFNGNELLKSVSGAYNGIYVLQKGYYATGLTAIVSTDKMGMITEEDIDVFKDTTNEGEMYLLYNMPIPLDKDATGVGNGNTINQLQAYQELYAKEAAGVLLCTEKYIARIYGKDGKIDLVESKNTSAPQSNGCYITDYMADCIVQQFDPGLFEFGDYPYDQLIGWIAQGRNFRINGVINTGYKERYSELIDAIQEAIRSQSREDAQKIYASNEYSEFVEEARTSLNVAYATDQDFLDAIIMNSTAWGEAHTIARLPRVDVLEVTEDGTAGKILKANTSELTCSINDDKISSTEYRIKPGEMKISKALYESLFGELSDISEFEEKELYIDGFVAYRNPSDKPLYSKKFKVVDVVEQTKNQASFEVCEEDYKFFRHYELFPYAIFFDQPTDIAALYNAGESRAFYSTSPQFSAVYTIVRVLKVYKDLFLTIAVVLFCACLLILFNFGRKIVRGRVYEIGLIRALGGRKIEIMKIFMFQLLFASLLICLVSVVGLFGITALANSILANSLTKVTQSISFKSMTLLVANPATFAIIILAVVGITILSALIPLIMLARIKPLNIIKAKE